MPMASLRRIMLATDLEPKSDRAMERAVHLARQFGAELTALHVVRGGEGPYAHLPLHLIEAELRRLLLAVPGADSVATQTVAVRGEAVGSQVAGYAGRWRPDLVVVGAHTRDSVADLFLPATAERIAVADGTPLLVVRDKPLGPYARVLVLVDFSEHSPAAVEAARRLLGDGGLHLLHVLDLPAGARPPASSPEVTGEFAEEFGRLLGDSGLGGSHITREVRIGPLVPEILRAARQGRYDLVVMGSARRDGLARAVLGSVAHEVITDLPCDALIAGGC